MATELHSQLQKRLQVEVDNYQFILREFQKYSRIHQRLVAHLAELSLYKQELGLIGVVDTSVDIYNVTDAVCKRSLSDEEENLAKRINEVSAEVQRTDVVLKDFARKRDEKQETLRKLQVEIQQSELVFRPSTTSN